ncbi:sugar transferase [Leucobacter triazinivorans]|uniref:Sugar transferase n=1 Tax=Leucobacter triazinivorans TaxID=1784719 RepID=A0A4V0Z1J6_9MICO|nr:sugar transferase [Leucobacter triazinivorans]QBE48639.1 sugar transferase [Leucobacter triazinivorans]
MAAQQPAWQKRYSRKLSWTDFAVIVISVFAGQAVSLLRLAPAGEMLPSTTNRLVFSALLAAGWLIALAVYDSRNPAVFGTGPEEYKRVLNSTIVTFGIAALLMLLFDPAEIRRYSVYVTLPLGLFLLVLGRWAWRKRLHRQRRLKKNTYRTIIAGDREHAESLVKQLHSNTLAGFELVGAASNTGVGSDLVEGVPIVAGYDRLLSAIEELDADTLIVAGGAALPPQRIRSIGWELEGRHVDLIVASSLTDIAGPRIHVRPVAGLPLIHVESPEFTGWRYYAKRVFDLVSTVVVLPLALLIVAVLAVVIKIDSPGPVFFRQMRMGLNGRPFNMFKLRSMREDADDALPGLLDRSEGNGVLFKIRADPRVTRVGQFMRRHSLDELPQLFNVLRGEMSLVGPRPPLPREASQYDDRVSRRLLVRPGISGLWQVSGRSDLSWEESVRLDLFYVENWSLTGDLLILWRTLRTVLNPEGAY